MLLMSQLETFYNSSIGQEPDRVFAMGLCIPGSKSKDCSDCITEGVTQWASSGTYYMANVTSVTTFQRIYALMECTPDLSPGNCDACFRANVGSYQECCRANIGGATRRPSCYVRWDLYPFLGAFDNITLASSPPTDNGDGAAKKDGESLSVGVIVGIVVAIVTFLSLLALGFAFHRRRKSYREIEYQYGDDISTTQSLQFDFKTIEAATDKFLMSNRLVMVDLAKYTRVYFQMELK